MKLVDKILRWRGKHFYRAPQVLTDLDYHLCWKWNMEMGKCDSVWRFWVVWTAEIGPFVPDKTGWYNLEPLDQSYSKKKNLCYTNSTRQLCSSSFFMILDGSRKINPDFFCQENDENDRIFEMEKKKEKIIPYFSIAWLMAAVFLFSTGKYEKLLVLSRCEWFRVLVLSGPKQ